MVLLTDLDNDWYTPTALFEGLAGSGADMDVVRSVSSKMNRCSGIVRSLTLKTKWDEF